MASDVRRPVLLDVARRAGVSLKTASRVLNGEPYVSPGMADRVRKAIADLGYVRNELARQLRAGGTRAQRPAPGGTLLAAPAVSLWDGEPPSNVATRTRNRLAQAGITTVGQLTGRSAADLAGIRNFGRNCAAEVRRVLAARGLALKGDPLPAGHGLRDSRGLPYEVIADGDCVVIVTGSGALRLDLEKREQFEQAYKAALAEVDHA